MASPLDQLELSSKSAAVRLIQCRRLGISKCDVSSNFRGGWTSNLGVDQEAFRLEKHLILSMESAMKGSRKLNESGWTPILYLWEVHQFEALSGMDYGKVVWIDKTQRNFLLVDHFGHAQCPGNCGKPNFKDYNSAHLRQVQKFFNLLHCLPRPPNGGLGFVRSTYTTYSSPLWTDDFLSGIESGTTRPAPNSPSDLPPIIHLSPSNQLIPAFHERNLSAIDTILRWGNLAPIDQEDQNQVLASAGEEFTLGFVPKHLHPSDWEPMLKICKGCSKTLRREMLRKCSGCHLSMYCSQPCQTRHWPAHKYLCTYGRKSAAVALRVS